MHVKIERRTASRGARVITLRNNLDCCNVPHQNTPCWACNQIQMSTCALERQLAHAWHCLLWLGANGNLRTKEDKVGAWSKVHRKQQQLYAVYGLLFRDPA
ncbi:uncharacterized protein LOC144162273 [Haemaphysalis longicornis]